MLTGTLPWDEGGNQEPKLETTRKKQRLMRGQPNTVHHNIWRIVSDNIGSCELLQGLSTARDSDSLPTHDTAIPEAILPAARFVLLQFDGLVDFVIFKFDLVVLRLPVP